MRFRKLCLAALLVLCLAVPSAAEVATKKYDWSPINGIQEVDVQDGKIVVGQVEFDLGSTLRGTPLRKSSAKVKIRLDNNGWVDEEVGVAVVVFDAEGNVVGAGSNGTKWGYLNKGDRTYYSIDFPYVYRRLDKAASFLITIETREKASGKQKTKAPEPEPEPTPTP